MPKAAAAMTVSCPKCQASYKVSEKQSGKKLRCQKCGRVFVIGQENAAPAKSKTGKTSKTGKSSSKSSKSKSSSGKRPQSSKQARPQSSKRAAPARSKSQAGPARSKTGKPQKQSSRRQKAPQSSRQARPDSGRQSSRKQRPESGRQGSKRQSSRQAPAQQQSGRRSSRRASPASSGPIDMEKVARKAKYRKKKGQGKLMISAAVVLVGIVAVVWFAISTPTVKEYEDEMDAKAAKERLDKEKKEEGGTTGQFVIPPLENDDVFKDKGSDPGKGKEKEKGNGNGSNNGGGNNNGGTANANNNNGGNNTSNNGGNNNGGNNGGTTKEKPPEEKPPEEKKPDPPKPKKIVREIQYKAAPTLMKKLEMLEDQIADLNKGTAGADFQRKLSDNILAQGKKAVPVLLNAFRKLDLNSEDGKGTGNFICNHLDQILELGEKAPIYNVRVQDPAGRNDCRKKWFEMWWAGKLK